MKELTWRNWHEWIETNELKWMNSNERIERNDLSTSSSKSGKTFHFFDLCGIELSLQSRADFVDLIFKKCSEPVSVWRFLSEIELSLQSRAHFVDHCPDRGVQPRKQRPSSGDHGQPLYLKNAGFCARECFQPWIHAFPIAHTSQLLDDDVIDMMMWLTWWLRWWCGCHDGETASHWQSSVTQKFPH